MRILFVTDHLRGTDGTSRYSKDIVLEMQRLGHTVLCAVSEYADGTDIEQRIMLERPIHYLANPVRVFGASRRLSALARRFRPDAIHFLVEPYALALNFLKPDAPTFITIHGTYAFMPAILSGFRRESSLFLTRRMYKRVNTVISVSHYTADYLERRLASIRSQPVIEGKIAVVHNGIRLPERTRKKEKTQHAAKNVLFVGTVKPRKGILEALQALNRYHNVSSNFIFHVVGSYDERDAYFKRLKRFVKQNHLEKKVIFHGLIPEKELLKLYGDADLFLMLSLNNRREFEGFGLVYLEANAHGVPTIGPNDSGAQEAIQDGISGYAVDPDELEDIAEKINLVLNKEAIRPEACIAWAKQHDIKKQVQKLLRLYVKGNEQ